MSLEQSIQNLADAILTLAASGYRGAIALEAQTDAVTVGADKPKRGPGRPPKNPEPAAPDAAPAADARIEVAAVQPVAPAPAAAASTVSKSDVQTVLIQVVQRISKAACTELCLKYGAPNISALDPAVYPALLADAKAALEKVAS